MYPRRPSMQGWENAKCTPEKMPEFVSAEGKTSTARKTQGIDRKKYPEFESASSILKEPYKTMNLDRKQKLKFVSATGQASMTEKHKMWTGKNTKKNTRHRPVKIPELYSRAAKQAALGKA
ncbi:hypothetical protein PoB_001337900 [Plakobranchus ocellatus]|uniref:Uncharacterized protein n=1 Tax=Plakobranchus ocellatus TaxID=259542 RepID=A0AAV3YYQ8_9GAST|nr:hypothetical protein PoB_001337900 [Plakobranchus ocellatus]